MLNNLICAALAGSFTANMIIYQRARRAERRARILKAVLVAKAFIQKQKAKVNHD